MLLTMNSSAREVPHGWKAVFSTHGTSCEKRKMNTQDILDVRTLGPKDLWVESEKVTFFSIGSAATYFALCQLPIFSRQKPCDGVPLGGIRVVVENIDA